MRSHDSNNSIRPHIGRGGLMARLAAAIVMAAWLAIGTAAHADDNSRRANDRIGINDMASCFAYSVDIIGNSQPVDSKHDPELDRAIEGFEQCFTLDAQLRLFFGSKTGDGVPAGAGGPAAFGDFVRGLFSSFGFIATQHLVGNVVVTFNGPDEAHVVSYIHASHWLKDGRIVIVPDRYEDIAVRTADGVWRLKTRDIILGRFWVADGCFANPSDPTLACP